MTTPTGLPIGFADQILDLQIRLQDEQSLEVIQILSQMYRIAVDYYIEHDIKRANYFQKKLNNLVIMSLSADSVQNTKPKKSQLPGKIKNQITKYEQCGKTYVQSIVENNQKTEKKLQRRVQEDLNRQQERLRDRMLKRAKSSGKLL